MCSSNTNDGVKESNMFELIFTGLFLAIGFALAPLVIGAFVAAGAWFVSLFNN